MVVVGEPVFQITVNRRKTVEDGYAPFHYGRRSVNGGGSDEGGSSLTSLRDPLPLLIPRPIQFRWFSLVFIPALSESLTWGLGWRWLVSCPLVTPGPTPRETLPGEVVVTQRPTHLTVNRPARSAPKERGKSGVTRDPSESPGRRVGTPTKCGDGNGEGRGSRTERKRTRTPVGPTGEYRTEDDRKKHPEGRGPGVD